MSKQPDNPYVSRGGLKLAAAIDAFDLADTVGIAGKTCCDLGCSVGGFVDVWLQRGAAKVYAVDTAYGTLAWKLRQDERVVVMERQNALHVALPEKVDLVSLDLGWTKQDKAIPAALSVLQDHADARIVTLIKPHYEKPHAEGQDEQVGETHDGARKSKRGKKHLKNKGKKHAPLSEEEAALVTEHVCHNILPGLGVEVLGCIKSPIKGAKGGNVEYLAILKRAAAAGGS